MLFVANNDLFICHITALLHDQRLFYSSLCTIKDWRTVGGHKAGGAALIGEGFMGDGLEEEVAAAHKAHHLVLLLQQHPQLVLEDLRVLVRTTACAKNDENTLVLKRILKLQLRTSSRPPSPAAPPACP